LEIKRKAEYKEEESEEVLGETGTGPQTFIVENNDYELELAAVKNEGNTAVLEGHESISSDEEDLESAEEEPEDDSELKNALKKKTRKKKSSADIRLSSAEIVRLILGTPKNNIERIKAFAEVLQITEEQAGELTDDDVANWA
jgi:hypothetical protein